MGLSRTSIRADAFAAIVLIVYPVAIVAGLLPTKLKSHVSTSQLTGLRRRCNFATGQHLQRALHASFDLQTRHGSAQRNTARPKKVECTYQPHHFYILVEVLVLLPSCWVCDLRAQLAVGLGKEDAWDVPESQRVKTSCHFNAHHQSCQGSSDRAHPPSGA